MKTDGLLELILDNKRNELCKPRAPLPKRRRRRYSLAAALARPGFRFIMECKKASPSAGRLRDSADLVPIVNEYRKFADAISVLTDAHFFDGSLDDLSRAAAVARLPILRKDFILDPCQVREAHAYGADAVLLMLSLLDDVTYRECAAEAARTGLETVCEVHDEAELERALQLDARIIGINNRSFRDLHVDRNVTRRLAPKIPADRLIVCESGIRDHHDVLSFIDAVDGFLVGSSLMSATDLPMAVRRLVFGEIKICGLTTAAQAKDAYRLGASWGGLVFAPGSARRIDTATALAIRRCSPLPIVGVFRNQPLDEVTAIATELGLPVVQLHGDEDANYITALKTRLPHGSSVWKAIAHDRLPLPTDTAADRWLIDNRQAGSGRPFDWSCLPEPHLISHCGLAGGIHAGNALQAKQTGAAFLDISSGVESAPGIKSPSLMRALFDALRGIGTATPTSHGEAS